MDYDELVHSKDIQILKSILPSLDRNKQMTLAIMIQFIELQNVLRLFQGKNNLFDNEIANETERQTAMLQAFMKQLSEDEQETYDSMMNMINMIKIMNTENMMENFESYI